MYNVDSGAFDGMTFSYFAGKIRHQENESASGKPKTSWEFQTANGIEAKVYIQALGTHLYVRLVEEFRSVLSLGRLCDALGYPHSWQPTENPN